MNIFSQNRILKGNVSIMVILILLACSLMGILTVVFLKSLITYTDDTYSYHKSYYIAKAGLELALTEIDNSSMGFSHDIYSGDFINENNFDCVGCHFTSRIRGRSGLISNNFWEDTGCTVENALVLEPGQSLTIPMFYDNTSSFDKILSDEYDITKLGGNGHKLLLDLPLGDNDQLLNIGVIFQSGSLTGDISLEYIYMTGISMNQNLFSKYFAAVVESDFNGPFYKDKLYPYIIISNPNPEQNVSFCVKDSDNGKWPTTKYFISSLGEYMGKTVGLQAIYAQPIPSFFINPYSLYGGGGSSVPMQYNENYY